MEAFERLPRKLPLYNNNSNNNENQPYLSLSQFDLELQAQFSMQQELEVWQDFENYLLPVEYNNNNIHLFNHHQHQLSSPPHISTVDDIRRQSVMNVQLIDLVANNGLPLNNILSNAATTASTPNNNDTTTTTTNTWTPGAHNSKVSTLTVEQQIKLEHTSPEQVSFTSPPNIQSSLSPFGSPDSMLHASDNMHYRHHNLYSPDHMSSDQHFFQNTSPMSVNNTPLETPLHSPKDDIFAAPSPINFPIHQPPAQQVKEQKSPIIELNTPTTTKSSSSTATRPVIPTQQKNTAHNVIERRYRNNINDRIAELKCAVPALLYAKTKDSQFGNKRSRRAAADEDNEEYLDGVDIATKLNKANILRKATEYIFHLKRTGDGLRTENATLQHLLGQLPGGHEILSRYRMQKIQREQEIQRQRLQERAIQKHHQRQQRKAVQSDRKRSRHPAHKYKSYSFSGSVNPLSAPVPTQQKVEPKTNDSSSVTNRVFMTVFMAISFFSASPLSAGPTSKEQYENHNHISRTADEMGAGFTNGSSSFLGSLFSVFDKWSTIRSMVFAICLIQLLFPLLKYRFTYGFFKVKRVTKKSRTTSNTNKSSLNISSHVTSLTPGDQKCMQIYNILVKSLENEEHNQHTVLPQKHYSTLGFYFVLGKEIARFVSRHWLGYEIFYDDQNLSSQEQWVQACKWIKLNEVECLGGNPEVTRFSMLYSCFRMLNLIELMEDDENEYVEQSRSRVYATTAMQMALVIPHHGFSEKLSRYFWRLSMYESGLEDNSLMRTLIFDCHEDDGEDRMEVMLKSRAWNETLEVMNQQIEHFGKVEARGLSLSMKAPVLVPVGILSTLHLLDNLQTQFGRLIISVTAKPLTTKEFQSDFNETVFAQLLDITGPLDVNERVYDYHRLVHWLAAVGATVDALWKSDTKIASKLIRTLVEKVPCSLVSRETTEEDGHYHQDLVVHKDRMNQLDELTKKSMIHILVGATLLKQGPEQQHRGVEELWKAEKIKSYIKKIMRNSHPGEQLCPHHHRKSDGQDLESSVLTLAEFVTAVTGLEAWISAWRSAPVLVEDRKERDVWESNVIEQVRHVSLHLRRMIRRHSLNGLKTNQVIVERLSRLGSYISSQIDEIDSACECSDFDNSEDGSLKDKKSDENHLLLRRSEKALEILRGLS